MPTEAPTPEALLGLGALTFLVTVLTEIIMRAVKPSDEMKDRLGPLAAITLGILIGVVLSVNRNLDAVQGIITGLYAGLGSMGLYKLLKTGYETAAAPPPSLG